MPGKRHPDDLIETAPDDVLTEAQLACLRLVPRGPSKVIAKELGISHHTVDNHIREAMRRLGVTTRYEAAQRIADWPAPADGAGRAPEAVHRRPTHDAPVAAGEGETDPLGRAGLGTLTRYWLRSLAEDLTGPRRLRGVLLIALIVSVIVLVLIGLGNALEASIHGYARSGAGAGTSAGHSNPARA